MIVRPLPPPSGRREVAVTFDDLPVISVTRGDAASHRAITTRLLEALAAHGVPAVGFVNEKNLMSRGMAEPERVALLRQWLDAGFELGNHTFGHLDLHAVPAAAFEDDVVRGEPVIRGLLDARGLPLRWFRHPYLHTGADLALKRRIEALLAGRGYRVAPVTVDTEDWCFSAAYDRAVERGDAAAARRTADAFVPYVESRFAYFESLSRRLLGYEVRQVLLLHANAINAERFDALARRLERRGYSFVTLERALQDPAYGAADDYAAAHGISWLSRWAMNQGCSAEFLEGEPETPRFVRVLSGEGAAGRLVRWWNRLHRVRRRIAGGVAPAPAA
jgi:peptidoglycan/xylan/chitin deacetylase (PgdA/CDA1 family)